MSDIAPARTDMADGGTRVLCDFWYARELPHLLIAFEVYALERIGEPARWLLAFVPSRVLLLLWLGRDFDAVAPNWYRGGRMACVLQAVAGRKSKLILLECIDYGIQGKGAAFRFIHRILAKAVIGPAMRRSVGALQTLTDWEHREFIRHYGLSDRIVHTIKWPLAGWVAPPHHRESAERYVFASGRTACDWETIFKAAEIGGWKLKIVCAAADRERVERLNGNVGAEILSEISLAHHDDMLAQATVYALCLQEQYKSSGQVRLAACISAGVPVVASAVNGLDGYLIDGVTAAIVRPGDAAQLAAKVEALVAEPALCAEQARRAQGYAACYTKADYFASLERFTRNAVSPTASSPQ